MTPSLLIKKAMGVANMPKAWETSHRRCSTTGKVSPCSLTFALLASSSPRLTISTWTSRARRYSRSSIGAI